MTGGGDQGTIYVIMLTTQKLGKPALSLGLSPLEEMPSTVDREIFTLKIIHIKIFRVDKFSRFVQSMKIF